MPQEKKPRFTLGTVDDMFTTQEMRDDAKLARIHEIPLDEIDEFPEHPYKVKDDEDMMNLVESIRENGVRHTFATRCIEAGIQPVVLKGWLGHTNIHVTLDTYADVFDRMNLGAISKFEDYMDKVLQGEE